MDTNVTNPSLALINTNSNPAHMMEKAIKTANSKNAQNIDINKVVSTSQEFEAVFIAEMMKPMFDGISTDGMFSGGKTEEIFRGMILEEYGKMTAKTGSIGLSDSIKDSMIKMQEQANNQ